MADIRILKMLSGENILTEVVEENMYGGKEVEIKNPVLIVVMSSRKPNDPTPTIGLAPWAEFSEDKTFTLQKSHIIAIMKPVKDFVDQYNAMFGKVITPRPGLIIPGN